jgi:hypothetical protein
MWVTCLSGLAACDADAGPRSDGGLDAGGVWQRCNEADLRFPGVQSRGSGSSLECFCPAGASCNYGWSGTIDVGPISAPGDAGMDAATSEEAGFSDASPMDDGSIDALMDAGEAVITDDASL